MKNPIHLAVIAGEISQNKTTNLFGDYSHLIIMACRAESAPSEPHNASARKYILFGSRVSPIMTEISEDEARQYMVDTFYSRAAAEAGENINPLKS